MGLRLYRQHVASHASNSHADRASGPLWVKYFARFKYMTRAALSDSRHYGAAHSTALCRPAPTPSEVYRSTETRTYHCAPPCLRIIRRRHASHLSRRFRVSRYATHRISRRRMKSVTLFHLRHHRHFSHSFPRHGHGKQWPSMHEKRLLLLVYMCALDVSFRMLLFCQCHRRVLCRVSVFDVWN